MMILRNGLYNTFPKVFHCMGPKKWKKYGLRFFNTYINYLKTLPDCKSKSGLITYLFVDTHKDRVSPLELSLKKFGFRYIKIGEGKSYTHDSRTPWVLEALELVDTPYVMGLDSYDCVVMDSPEYIVSVFKDAFKCRMVYNTEMLSFPPNKELYDFETSVNEYPYAFVNAGAWISETDFYKEVLNFNAAQVPRIKGSDQEINRLAHKHFYPDIQADDHCRIFQTACATGKWGFDKVFKGRKKPKDLLRLAEYLPHNGYYVRINKTVGPYWDLTLLADK